MTPMPALDVDARDDPPDDEIADGRDVDSGEAAPEPADSLSCAPAIDDAQLVAWIAGIVERDERALAALYDATFHRVYGLVLRIVRRPAWADEVVEDAYFQVWRQAPRYDAQRGRALTWLLGMARSRAIDALRRESRFDHQSLDAHDDSADDATPPAQAPAADEWLACAEGHGLLHRALSGLSAPSRQLLALAFFRGLSHEEIAEHTALPLGTVKSQIRRALIALRKLLGERGLSALPT